MSYQSGTYRPLYRPALAQRQSRVRHAGFGNRGGRRGGNGGAYRDGATARSFVAFLMIASFGMLFVGCGGQEVKDVPALEDEFSFTEKDVAEFRRLVDAETDEWPVPRLELGDEGAEGDEPPILDLSLLDTYDSIRVGGSEEEDIYRITGPFLNVRGSPSVTAPLLEQLENTEPLTVLEFVNAAWAKIRLRGDREGFVSARYIAKVVSEEELSKEKKKYEGLYYVNFGFLNVRKDPDADSEKIGELNGQEFVRPLSMDDVWARIPYGDSEGYVVVRYLAPFLPNYRVRQNAYTLPILQYQMSRPGSVDALIRHVDDMRNAGYKIQTLRSFYDHLLAQEQQDVRLSPKTIVLTVAEVMPENMKEVSDALRASSVNATVFIQTKYFGGEEGISTQQVHTLLANGQDVQSGAHSGDDLRSLTNAQVKLELNQSRQLIEQVTKRQVYGVLYPIGGVNSRISDIAAEVGYLLGVGTAADRTFERSQLLRLPSIVVRPDMTNEELLEIIGG